MENLLQRIVDSGATIAIIDITGVSTVDTVTAQHLLETVAAARLMGAECIISGIRPQIAQTILLDEESSIESSEDVVESVRRFAGGRSSSGSTSWSRRRS
jgi:anti-anti-sigma regulatory factor